MTLDVTTDLIAGVMAAADPARQRLAAQRLEVMARGAGVAERTGVAEGAGVTGPALADARSFADVVADLSAMRPEPPPPPKPGVEEARIAMLNQGAAGQPPAAPGVEAAQQFEAVALQAFLGAMMPPAASAMAGGGTAGSMWASLLTEHIAAAMARAGGVGIAAMLARGQEPPRS